ncbi:hypothetical protein SNE26_23305 [Mucilaginibacter sp. cycad4]|uniref:hypothetical protein n=1 Tax=Mucilaginibacter sp. cycad4 TaxID=3342096 RepID=UPI002AAC3A09|nr:hypothetical protein [Mucilaginibacter gossypii]WPU98943.1 hypothetical protein SNE26_23305 [Mucilaginibacter gossypii]
MKTNLLLSAVIICLISCSNSKLKNDLDKDDLKGPISKFTETEFSASEKFGEAHKEKQQYLISSKYNKDGNMTNQEVLSTLDSSAADHTIYEMQYNDKGQKISIKNIKKSKPHGFYKYTADGLLSEYDIFDDNGALFGKTIFTYTDNLISSETTYNKTGEIDRKIVYKRNNKGLVEELSEYDSSGTIKNKTTQTYNADNLVEKVISDSDGYKFVSTFKYFNKDEKGNFLKIVRYDKTDKPLEIIERKIEYY